MGKTLFAHENWSNTATVASVDEDTVFPATNLKTTQVRGGDRFRTVDATEMVITADRAGDIQPFNFVGALYGIAGLNATWRVVARTGGSGSKGFSAGRARRAKTRISRCARTARFASMA